MHIIFKQFCKASFLNSPDSEHENSEFMKINVCQNRWNFRLTVALMEPNESI